MRTVTSPWLDTFQTLLREIHESLLVASPFIGAEPVRLLSSELNFTRPLRVEILTNLSVDNLLDRSTDPHALSALYTAIPTASIRHLAGLHAKVYIADDRVAIVTSSNLTRAGLWTNYEFGVLIDEPEAVQYIVEDIKAYADLGTLISPVELENISLIASDLQQRQRAIVASARAEFRREFQSRVEGAQETLRQLRAKPGESTNSIFSRTILYLLSKRPLSTVELHPLIQDIHPDLCDDAIDRVINGVHFGKRWKHMVRNAQQTLKEQGLVEFDGRKWRLI